jgi:NAD(P)-dependent dehydrogenase (short-subunit alcohol dehydrogenase family)
VQELRGKVAVITGGASGIGRAVAERLATEGVRLVLADIEEPVLAETTAALRGAGAEVLAVPTDVSKIDDVRSLAAATLDAYGAVHIVCNNAGVASRSVLDISIEQWEWIVGVNLWGVIYGCHVFGPLLRDQNEGHIVNTASLAGLRGIGLLGSYCTTKFAVVGLSESLQNEFTAAGSAVRVSVLCPSFVRTRIGESARNMPPALAAMQAAERAVETAGVINQMMAGAMDPAIVADQVHDAIRTERFYVLPHPDAAYAATSERLAWMMAGGPVAPAGDERTLSDALRPPG